MFISSDKRYVEFRQKEMESEIRRILLVHKALEEKKNGSSIFSKTMLRIGRSLVVLGKKMENRFGAEKCCRPLETALPESH
jgi:hypothetical protein